MNRASYSRWAIALLAVTSVTFAIAPAAVAAPTVGSGDTVYVGDEDYYSGAAFRFPVYVNTPSDPDNPGEPDYWAYCIEHDESAQQRTVAEIGDFDSFLGSNYFATDPAVPGKVLWVLAHGFPALSLADFGAAAGTPGITKGEALNAMQTAIWRYTDLTFDAAWDWDGSQNAEDAYWYLVNGANASSGMSPADFETTVSVTAPAGSPVAGTLVGPFVVHTNKPTVSVSVDPASDLVDVDGDPVDATAVVDGQELYLDLRGETTAGSATVTASAKGSSSTGLVLTVPSSPGGAPPTEGDHGQSTILVAASTAVTTASADVEWAAVAGESEGPAVTGQLANTGVDLSLPLGVGLGLAVLGVIAVLAARRLRGNRA